LNPLSLITLMIWTAFRCEAGRISQAGRGTTQPQAINLPCI
jgi:hypothetical protein